MDSTVFFIVGTMVMAVVVPPTIGFSVDHRATCLEDYAPCSCSDDGSLSVSCNQVPLTQVQDVFSRTTAQNLASFTLTIAPTEMSSIPANLLQNSRAGQLNINCGSSSYNLVIDDNAFSSSKLLTQQFSITGCDLNQQPNFDFLSGFEAMTSFSLWASSNFNSFQGIPSQSQLNYITIWNSQGFENLADGPTIALPGLKFLDLPNNGLDNLAAAKILKIFTASSNASLQELRLHDNKLTRIPEQISSYSKLNRLMLERNTITLINTRSLAFFGLLAELRLEENSISSIEPSAFGGGNFNMVFLHQNALTRFESYVFQVMLEGMVQRGYGSISLFQNPIECDCHLAWLIVYKPNLLSVINTGQCSNSTYFNQLNPGGFVDCPVFTCPAGIDGNFPNPLSCSSYYICSAGTSILVNCPGGLVFNPAYQICDWPYNVPTCNP